MEKRKQDQLKLLIKLIAKHQFEMPMFIPSYELEHRLKYIKEDVEITFKAFGFENMDVTVQCVDSKIDVFIEERPWYKEASMHGTLDSDGTFHETKKPLGYSKYDETLALLVTLYGEPRGTFLANRLAGMIHKNVNDVTNSEIFNVRIGCVGNHNDEASYALQKHQKRGIQVDGTFMYQTKTGTNMYMIGFDYREYDND